MVIFTFFLVISVMFLKWGQARKGTLTKFFSKKEMNLGERSKVEFPPTGQKWAISFLDGRSGSRYIPLKA